jgi:hypothetical protein
LNTGTITTLDNTGTIKHGSPGADAIDSVGSIATLSNRGQIMGAVELLGGSGDTLDNLGQISGNVMLAGGDLLMNQGQVYGDVTLGRADTFTDTGAIHGDVTLGASDTFDASGGEITGAITASSGDLLEFSRNFGHETIDNFTAGTGAAHDTLELGSVGFGGFQAVHHAISQVGSDTVIRLDAADSITLVGVAKSSLVAAAFKFV